jgi:hypothetical protein
MERRAPVDIVQVFSSRGLNRRRFLTVTAAVAGAGVLAGCGLSPQKNAVTADPDKADAIRREMKQFEADNRDNVSNENVIWLYGKIAELHTAAFGLPQVKTTLIAFGHELIEGRAQELGLSQARQDVPWGDASAGLSAAIAGNRVARDSVAVMIYTGRDEVRDPNVNKLSVVRLVAEHEYIHSQTRFIQPGLVSIDGVQHNVVLQRGLKWVVNEPGNSNKAWYFDESNTQLLAEFMHDPGGEDPTPEQIMRSPVYRNSISWIRGGGALRSVYRGLCIPEGEVRQFHFQADPQGLLNRIDTTVTRNGIVLPLRASSTLIRLDPRSGTEDSRVRALEDMAAAAGFRKI